MLSVCVRACKGYGFVDFDSPAAAQKAVAALKTTGVQAQMAKVRTRYCLITHLYKSPSNSVSTVSGWSGNLKLVFVVLNSRTGIPVRFMLHNHWSIDCSVTLR